MYPKLVCVCVCVCVCVKVKINNLWFSNCAKSSS